MFFEELVAVAWAGTVVGSHPLDKMWYRLRLIQWIFLALKSYVGLVEVEVEAEGLALVDNENGIDSEVSILDQTHEVEDVEEVELGRLLQDWV